jgi:hypothetical protein
VPERYVQTVTPCRIKTVTEEEPSKEMRHSREAQTESVCTRRARKDRQVKSLVGSKEVRLL